LIIKETNIGDELNMEFKTIDKSISTLYIEKKSRFIGNISSVQTEDEAKEFIKKIKTKHWDATHNVYAYVLREGQSRRYSDDGEPQGTAGMPVLEVLLKESIFDVVLVITRYFGGTMLGAGGLVRAYSHTTKLAIDEAGIRIMKQYTVMSFDCPYSEYKQINSLILELEGVIVCSDFLDTIKLIFKIPNEEKQLFIKKFNDLVFGSIKINEIEEIFGA
jgi:uncharacterized YigZ family protein